MSDIFDRVVALKSHPINETIVQRLKEFDFFKENISDSNKIFLELCFCLMTANFQAEKSMSIQKELGKGFHFMSEDDLAKKLKVMGHRFWPQVAQRIVLARKHIPILSNILKEKRGLDLRQWFVDNVYGLGMKESSHFLRNIGFRDYAIIDFHIVDILVEHGLIDKPKSKGITQKKYLEIEKVLQDLGKKLGMSMSELDLRLWYLETGKVLK